MSIAADLPPDPSAPARGHGGRPVTRTRGDADRPAALPSRLTTANRRTARGEPDEISRHFLALAALSFERRAAPGDEELGEVRAAAARWAREAVSLRTVLRDCHEGLRTAFGERAADATDLLLETLQAVTAAVCDAYVEEQYLLAREQQIAAQTLASALLSGHAGSAVARHSGLPIAESYQVVALAVPARPDEAETGIDAKAVDTGAAATRTLRRLQSALARAFGAQAPALLAPTGGTLLLPRGIGRRELTTELLGELSAATEAPLSATAVVTEVGEVPEAADQAHELLDLVRIAGRAPGLYTLADLAMEYQLTRGGPANRQLAGVLEPLDDHPELFDTLRAYLRNDMNRRLSARQLFVHPNTIDYRLRRITQLTGMDLATSAGISQASTALLARDLRHTGPRRR